VLANGHTESKLSAKIRRTRRTMSEPSDRCLVSASKPPAWSGLQTQALTGLHPHCVDAGCLGVSWGHGGKSVWIQTRSRLRAPAGSGGAEEGPASPPLLLAPRGASSSEAAIARASASSSSCGPAAKVDACGSGGCPARVTNLYVSGTAARLWPKTAGWHPAGPADASASQRTCAACIRTDLRLCRVWTKETPLSTSAQPSG
jgi:hypothetical protein